MKIKNRYFLAISLILCLILTVSATSWAGSKERHRWEGFAIGLGAAVLGSALLGHHFYRHDTCVPLSQYTPPPPPPPEPNGHWEIRKIWIPPQYERIWNPGHYNGSLQWVPGRWIEIEKVPGYWQEERIWVSHY